MYLEGEVPYVSTNNGNNNGWNDWSWIIGLALVGGLFGGWGGNGFGFGGGRGYGNPATQADLAAGFANSEIMSDLNSIINAQTQGFAGLNTVVSNAASTLGYNMLQGFHGVDNAICTLGYNQGQLVNGISRELAECCCTTQRNIDSLRFDMSKGFCDVIRSGQDNTKAILDYLTTEKISSLQAENAGLKAQISNDMQTRTIINEVKPCPIPAYITCNPYQSAYGFGLNNGCGGCNNF